MKYATMFGGLILLAACGGEVPESAVEASTAAGAPDVAPAIISPQEVADPALPPSYEVAIAGAAADRNAAQERCAKQPQAVRTQCEQEANAAFSEAQGGLDRLRGNQP
jgi:hypothetical protein